MSDDRWRDDDAYAYQKELSLAGVAWEFLRRNAGYQAEFDAATTLAREPVNAAVEAPPDTHWGLSLFADPSHSAHEQAVFWRPGVNPRTLVLTAAPLIDGAAVSFDPSTWPGRIDQRVAGDGAHLLLRIGTEEHRLWAAEPLRFAQPIVVAQPLDAHLAIRADAAERLMRRLTKPSAPTVRPERGSLVRRSILMLRAMDGRSAGASQRRIAEVLLGVRCASPREWEDCAGRAMIARLLRLAAGLRGGGYLALLRRGRGR
jgi:hypothetical protein